MKNWLWYGLVENQVRAGLRQIRRRIDQVPKPLVHWFDPYHPRQQSGIKESPKSKAKSYNTRANSRSKSTENSASTSSSTGRTPKENHLVPPPGGEEIREFNLNQPHQEEQETVWCQSLRDHGAP